jgi:phospholipase C
MPTALESLKHIVVVMMENRSFDHMLGFLRDEVPAIDGLTGGETNPDTTGTLVPVNRNARYHGELEPDPGHHWEDIEEQVFGNPPGGPTMQGFITAYFRKQASIEQSRKIMNCFPPSKLPVLATLARKYAVFNAWFSSLPGPTVPNRAFAHFGTSFGKVGNSIVYAGARYKTIYERMIDKGRSAKIYYYDPQSSTLTLAFLFGKQPQIFGTFDQFVSDCKKNKLPDYCFLEPNYSDHDVGFGMRVAQDQHPNHNVMAGEGFIKDVYEALRQKKAVWESTAMLVVYDEHGGLYDHVEPPSCPPDEFEDAGTGFKFDRLGVRVPAVLISPWIPEGTVVPSGRVFDHASIPATVTEHFIGTFDARSPREKNADTFLDLLSLPAPRTDEVSFPDPAEPLPASPTPMAGAVGDSPVPLAFPPPEGRASRLLTMDSLLWDHLLHFYHEDSRLPVRLRTDTYLGSIRTEGEAAAYIARITGILADYGKAKAAARKARQKAKKTSGKTAEKPARKKKPTKKAAKKKPAKKATKKKTGKASKPGAKRRRR